MISILINVLSISAIFLCIALGLNIIFGVMGVVNFAHGEFLMIGAYATYFITRAVPGLAGILLAVLGAFAAAAAVGALCEVTLIRRVYLRPFDGILITWSISLILQQLARSIFGASNVDARVPDFLSGGLSVANANIPFARLFIFALAVAVTAGLYLFMYKTRTGTRVQAVMQNRSMAACLGISIQKINLLTFALGCGIAGIAGVAVALLGSIGPSTGQNYIIDSFLVVVIGGVGTLLGTVVGALALGIISPLFELYVSSNMARVAVYALIILMLRAKPAGLIVRKVRTQGS